MPDSVEKATVVVENGKILCNKYYGAIPENAYIIDALNGYVIPGFVDIHVHGGGGYDFMDATQEAFLAVANMHIQHGTTSLVPTTVSCSADALKKVFAVYRKVMDKCPFLGIHLEGPYISNTMKGAHNEKYIHAPTKYEVDALLDAAGDIIVECSAAPEIHGASYLARQMTKKEITMSIAHSNAVCDEIKQAIAWGFTHVTHLYSNTPCIRKINQIVHAGIVEAAYLYDALSFELIGDGKHVPQEALQMAVKLKGADKIAFITDAMRAAGQECQFSYLGEPLPENKVIIEDGVAKLPDRSYYAGSIATSDIVFKNVVNAGISINDTSKMLSLTPAKVIGKDSQKGSLDIGKDADIIIMSREYVVKKVILNGEEWKDMHE